MARFLNRLRKNSLGEGDGLQPVRLNVKMNRLQPLRVLLRTEKQYPQGLNRLRKIRDRAKSIPQGLKPTMIT
jgi:hypothetical protein